jgi:hypothetical protein
LVETASAMFQNPMINIYSHEVMQLVRFYEGLGFRETFRTPKQGTPVHVEVSLDRFKIGIASVEAAIADHGLSWSSRPETSRPEAAPARQSSLASLCSTIRSRRRRSPRWKVFAGPAASSVVTPRPRCASA